jgi:ABC-type sugar transport system substrate-binding protein
MIRIVVTAIIMALVAQISVSIAAKEITVGYVAANMTATSQVRVTNAFTAQSKAQGWKVATADAKGSWPALADQIENFVQMKVDVLVVAMSDLTSVKAAIATANKAKIPVISIDSGAAPGVIADITTDNYVMGSKISSFMVDKLGHKGNIIVFKFSEHHGTRKRGKALDMVLSENPEIKVLATHNLPPAGFMQDAQARMETYLTQFPGQIDAVWCPWDGPAMAVTMALQAARVGRDKTFVTGVDGEQATFDLIRSGSPLVATVAQPFELMAARAVQLIDELVVKGKPASQVVPSNTIYVDAPLVTPANVPAKGSWPWD